MTRGYWGGVMLVSILITGACSWYVFTALQEKNTIEVPLMPIMPVPVIPEPTPIPTADPALFIPVPSDEPVLNSSGNRRIQFTLPSATAKKVSIVGSFNKWFRKNMTQKDNVWSIAIELAPGTYEYKFVVDNKRIKDPNNKSVSKAGNSILIVKPASAN